MCRTHNEVPKNIPRKAIVCAERTMMKFQKLCQFSRDPTTLTSRPQGGTPSQQSVREAKCNASWKDTPGESLLTDLQHICLGPCCLGLCRRRRRFSTTPPKLLDANKGHTRRSHHPLTTKSPHTTSGSSGHPVSLPSTCLGRNASIPKYVRNTSRKCNPHKRFWVHISRDNSVLEQCLVGREEEETPSQSAGPCLSSVLATVYQVCHAPSRSERSWPPAWK